jgi:hypothetical protein
MEFFRRQYITLKHYIFVYNIFDKNFTHSCYALNLRDYKVWKLWKIMRAIKGVSIGKFSNTLFFECELYKAVSGKDCDLDKIRSLL